MRGFVYYESIADSEHGIKASARWEDMPENWACRECRVSKADFEIVRSNG